MAATESPPQEQPSMASHASKKKKITKRKRNQNNTELERFNSLSWNPSLNSNAEDPFASLFVGSDELDGGFLSLEEINEADYDLLISKPENEKLKKPLKLKRQKSGSDDDGSSEVIEAEANEEEEKEENSTTKKKKKNKKKNKTKKPKDTQQFGESSAVSVEDEPKEDEIVNDDEISPEFDAWNELRLHPLLMKSICRLGFKEPTEIQKACIPAAAHQGKDVVGAAETGSGKTLAFGLPILQRLLQEQEKSANTLEEKKEETGKYGPPKFLRALVITPTRELALQVTDHLKEVAKGLNISVVPIVGGMSTEKQERLLKARPEIIVGTPGRLWELMSRGEKHLVELHSLSFFVLDEADRMIENGHFRELQSIIDMLPISIKSVEGKSQSTENCSTVSSLSRKKRQTFVFSATIALSTDFRKKLKRGASKSKQHSTEELNSIEVLSERAGMRDNVAIVDLTSASILARKLEESFIECRGEDKDAYLYYILSVHGQGRTIVFCTSISALRHISAILHTLGVQVWTLHAQMQQRARLKAMDRFRSSDNGILAATDVAARGLDIPGVRTVIHYQLPHSAEVYVHRSGRTARASADGCSIALISSDDTSKFASLCQSFSKESVKRFPLQSAYMPEVMKRLSLARQIDKIMRKESQEKTKKNWFERNAESVELIVEDDDSEDERVNTRKQKKISSMQLKNLQQELKGLLSCPLQPKTFSHRYLAGAGISPLLQQQFEELARQNKSDNKNGENNKRKMMVIGHDCMEPLQALRAADSEMMNMKGPAGKRRNVEDLRRKRKDEKKRLHDQRRKLKKQQRM